MESENSSVSSYEFSSGESRSPFKTPRKKRYRKALRHGLSDKRARYYERQGTLTSLASASEQTSSTLSDQNEPMPVFFESRFPCSSSSSDSEIDSETEDTTTASNSSSDFSESWSENDDDEFNEHAEENAKADEEFEDGSFEKIYCGCRQTFLSSYTMVLLYVMKHSLSKEAFLDLLLLIESHLPINTGYFKSVYKMKCFLRRCGKIKEPKIHWFCDNCQQLLPGQNRMCSSSNCRNVEAKALEFHDLDLVGQMKELFKEDSVCNMVKKTIQHNGELPVPTVVRDICDGTRYRELQHERTSNGLHLTLTMNTDGVALFSSSKKGNLWPIYIAINEIPIRQRFSKKYILTSYLYCHSEKPNMLSYMLPQMEVLKQLSEGMEFATSTGRLWIKASLLAVTCDLPAKALVSNMKQFNGKFGCSVCLDEGQGRPNCPMHRYWPYKDNSIMRTHNAYIEDVKQAVQSKKVVNGVKGACPLIILNYVDVPKTFVVDWMHCVLLGVTKSLMNFWFSSTHKDSGIYIGDKLPLLNRRLSKIEIPDFMPRRQRALEDSAHWKATECREWLFHFSVPVLEGILTPIAYTHYMLLVTAMHLLNKEEIKAGEIDYSEMLLLDFCRLFPQIYGNFQQTMNIHQLKHLTHFVRLYGPLFTTSCFGFESMNNHLKSMVHGTRFVNSQVSLAVGLTKTLPKLVKAFENDLPQELQDLVGRLSSKLMLREESGQDETKVLGKMISFQAAEELATLVLSFCEENSLNREKVKKFLRLRKNNETFYSKHYKQAKTRNSYTVQLMDDEITIILFYLSISDKLYAVIQKLDTVPEPEFKRMGQEVTGNAILRKYDRLSLCHYIREVKLQKEYAIIDVHKIQKKCVYMKFNMNKLYVSLPPNLLEHS